MNILIMADIHSHLSTLESVFPWIEKRNIKTDKISL